MKKLFKSIVIVSLTILVLGYSHTAFAGNKDRSGQAGATELLINPWAASAGWANAGMSKIHGVEAMWGNVAGITATNSIDLNFSYTNWLQGSGVNAYSFGVLARVSETVVAGLYVMSFSPGEIYRTTTENPDLTLGTYKPSLMNINIAVAKSFSNSIHAGFVLKIISESISDMVGTGVALDAGIQYVTGDDNEFKFGVSLKNIGPALSFSGDGLARTLVDWGGVSKTVEERSQAFEMPTCLNIGLSYDFLFDAYDQRLTLAGNFTSNAFMKDNFIIGAEYSLLNMFQVRGGFVYQNDIFSEANRTSAMTGPTAGASVKIPLSKQKGDKPASSIGLDYSYRSAAPFKGSHSIGVVLSF